MQALDLSMAPLRGVTLATFREVFERHFGGLDRAVAPFVPTVAGDRIRPSLLKDFAEPRHGGMRVIPQLIGKDPDQLAAMLAALRNMGYSETNLNLGCPWKFVIKKGRGCGLMREADTLRRMLEAGCAAMPGGFSVKLRLGIRGTDLLAERLDLLNEFPLSEIIIHPRTAQQMYEGEVDLDAFAAVYGLCHAPVTYNGDIFSVSDFCALRRRFPDVSRWMIGRGLVADPFLPQEIRAAVAWQSADSATDADSAVDSDSGAKSATQERAGAPDTAIVERGDKLRAYHGELYGRYRAELFGPASILGRMKEFWGYFHQSLKDGEALLRRIQRSRSLDEYERLVSEASICRPRSSRARIAVCGRCG